MKTAASLKTLSVEINRPPEDVYEYVLNPEKFPEWASSFCRSVKTEGEDWIVDTVDGPMRIRFVERNRFGLLDHYAYPSSGGEILNLMRAVPHRSGSVVIFTVFRPDGVTDEQFARDTGMVEQDLYSLKGELER